MNSKIKIGLGAGFYFVTSLLSSMTLAQAENVPINGTVQSRCIIQTDNPGVYGNPNAYTLTTDVLALHYQM